MNGEPQITTRQIAIAEAILRNCRYAPGSVLDVGCGNGAIADYLRQRLPCVRRVEGVEILPRRDAFIPVRRFDGTHLPYQDGEFELILLSDVLHHIPTVRGQLRLLQECARASSKAVIVKDHLCDSKLALLLLAGMDWIGNHKDGVPLPFTYHTTTNWHRLARLAGLKSVRSQTRHFNIYAKPLAYLAEGGVITGPLHVLHVFEKA